MKIAWNCQRKCEHKGKSGASQKTDNEQSLVQTVKMNGKCHLDSCFHALHRSAKKKKKSQIWRKKSYKMAATANRKLKVPLFIYVMTMICA